MESNPADFEFKQFINILYKNMAKATARLINIGSELSAVDNGGGKNNFV